LLNEQVHNTEKSKASYVEDRKSKNIWQTYIYVTMKIDQV